MFRHTTCGSSLERHPKWLQDHADLTNIWRIPIFIWSNFTNETCPLITVGRFHIVSHAPAIYCCAVVVEIPIYGFEILVVNVHLCAKNDAYEIKLHHWKVKTRVDNKHRALCTCFYSIYFKDIHVARAYQNLSRLYRMDTHSFYFVSEHYLSGVSKVLLRVK